MGKPSCSPEFFAQGGQGSASRQPETGSCLALSIVFSLLTVVISKLGMYHVGWSLFSFINEKPIRFGVIAF